MRSQVYNFRSMFRGDTFKGLKIKLTQDDGTPIPLTNVKAIDCHFRKTFLSPCPSFTFSTSDNTIVITDENGNEFSLVERLMDYEATKYVYDVQFTYDDYSVVTLIHGEFILKPDVTR